jgi:hypothetical protein
MVVEVVEVVRSSVTGAIDAFVHLSCEMTP